VCHLSDHRDRVDGVPDLRSGSQVNHGTKIEYKITARTAHAAPELELAAAAGLHRRLSQRPQRAARVSTAAESFNNPVGQAVVDVGPSHAASPAG